MFSIVVPFSACTDLHEPSVFRRRGGAIFKWLQRFILCSEGKQAAVAMASGQALFVVEG